MKATRRATTESDLYPLIEAAYEAATRPEAWTDFLTLLCETAGADAGVLQIYDTSRARGSATWWWGTPDAAVAEYPNWIAKNPHLTAIAPVMRTGSIMVNTPVSRAEYRRSEYYNDYMRHHLPLYASSGVVIYSDGPLMVSLAADRLAKRNEFDSDHETLLARLLPHLQRAMAIHRRLADADLLRMASVEALDRLEFGVLLLSDHGTIITTNESARTILSDGDALTITADGRIKTQTALGRAELDALIKSACGAPDHPERTPGGAIRLGRSGDRLPLEVLVAPLRLREFALTRRPPSAVMFVHDPERTVTPLVRLRQLYGLTAAEGRVAQELIAGRSVTELSEELQVTIATARTHVRRLLEKSGAKSISDLTRRLAGLPPVI